MKIIRRMLCTAMLILALTIVSIAQRNTVAQDHGASLLGWSLDGRIEYHVYIRFDTALLVRARRAFKAFDVAYASGIGEVTFDVPVQLTVNGVPYTGTMHIGAIDLYPPAMWFELRLPDYVFTDSLTYEEVFGKEPSN